MLQILFFLLFLTYTILYWHNFTVFPGAAHHLHQWKSKDNHGSSADI